MRPRPLLLSIVIPTLNEAGGIDGLLTDLEGLSVPREVILTDGGSADGTCDIGRRAGATILNGRRGRGTQLRAGAATARAPLLCFLHADVRLRADAIRLLDELAVARPPCALAFRLRIDAPGPAYRLIEWAANLRSRVLGLPYGDQGLVVRREDYVRAGGFPAIPLMEDVALIRALRRTTRVHLLEASVHVSARRWRREGALRRTLGNWVLLARFLAGASAERLAARYSPEGAAHD